MTGAILAIQVTRPTDLEMANPSLIGGDILGGNTRGLDFARRPTLHPAPWRTPIKHSYHCSSAIAPGPGVHGMTGYLAAVDALRTHYGLPAPSLAHTGGEESKHRDRETSRSFICISRA